MPCRPVHQTVSHSGVHVCAAGRRPGSSSSRRPQVDGPPTLGSTLAKNINSMLRDAESLPELADTVNEWGSSFDPIHTATAFYMAGRLAQREPAAAKPLLETLAGIWDSLLPDAGHQAMTNVLWACSKLRYSNPQLWSSTLTKYLAQLQHTGQEPVVGQQLSNTLYGLATIALANKGQVPGMIRSEVEAAVQQLAARMQVLVRHPQLEGVKVQEVANALWACAKLHINPGDAALNSMLQAMARPAMIEAATVQNTSNALWAVSELHQHCGWQPKVEQRVWHRLLDQQQIVRIADRDKPLGVASSLLALAWLATPAPSATAAAAGAAATAVFTQEFAAQCALPLLRGQVAQQLVRWEARQICCSMWACAKLGLKEASFLQRAGATAHKWALAAEPLDLFQAAYACTALQFKEQRLMLALLQRSKQHQQQQGKRGLSVKGRTDVAAAVGYAVAALDMRQLAGHVRELAANSGITRDSTVKRGNLNQLWEVHAWLLQHQLLDGQGLAGLLSQQQLEAGRAAAEAGNYEQQQQQ
uniref:FAST kinase leucine-rich domain-containing protein n=1 Tax=Tetradesmus obliquus TaxID=3088 RepID=A0A383V2M9_TETOB|eukprot:jgi/Sobl393_1/1355/SZX59828.1